MMFLLVGVVVAFLIGFTNAFSTYYTENDVYGSLLVANEHLVVSAVDRTYPSFAVYRPYNSSEFCIFKMNICNLLTIYVTHLSVPDDSSNSPDQFYYQGVITDNNTVLDVTIVQVTNISLQNCTYSCYCKILPNSTADDYSVFDISPTNEIVFYLGSNITYMNNYVSTADSYIYGRVTNTNPQFIYFNMEIASTNWGVIAGAIPDPSGAYIPTLYLINYSSSITSGSYNYNITDTWSASLVYSWQKQIARSATSSSDYNPMYGMSLSINEKGDILFGVQYINTVFLLTVDQTNPKNFNFISSRFPSTTSISIGFGKSVSWLDNTTAVILANSISIDYTVWYSSRIEIYDLSQGQNFTDSTQAYSSFPSIQQPMYSSLSGNIIIMTATYTGSIIFMDSLNQLYIIRPSSPGYFSYTNVGNTLKIGAPFYYSSLETCPDGTVVNTLSGNKHIFDPCQLCPEGTFRSSSSNVSVGCETCDTTLYFCPFGAVAQVPWSYMQKITQVTAFPQSQDLIEFDDILLMDMFNTKFQTFCIVRTPFFWILIITCISIIALIIMTILEWLKKGVNILTKIRSVFRHFDIIKRGEHWVTGVLSFSVFATIIFAALYSSSFIKQYPNASSKAPAFSCDQTLRNSQFSSQMRSLGTNIPDNAQQIFDLLKSQQFVLSVTLLNTIVNTSVTVQQTVGTITTKLKPILSVPTNGCLTITTNLTANIATFTFNISSSQRIGGVRISLSAAGIVDQYNEAKDLYFADSFTLAGNILSQQPSFTVELIQFINETMSLSANEPSEFYGLWIPTYSQDETQNFDTLIEYEKYYPQPYTILTIDLTQAVYYIYNLEKPVIKTSGMIFKNILFASTCMELVGFCVLVVKLAIVPLIRRISRLISSKNKEENAKENNDSDAESNKEEKEEEEEEEEESNEMDDTPQREKYGLAENEWYTPEVKT